MSKSIKKRDADFEIAFYAGLIEKLPNFAEALAALGDLYTRTGRYTEGLAVDERLAQLRPADPIVLYNLACSYSLLQELDKAYRAFKKAAQCGYCDYDYLEKDDDLVNLRADRRFQRYLARLKNKNLSGGQE